MRFYDACVAVAQQIENEMTPDNRALFMETRYSELWKYHFTVGMWIRNQYLNESEYLYKALLVLGHTTKDDMSSYLVEFAQEYMLLKRADML